MRKISKIAALVGTLLLSSMFFNTASASNNPFAQQASTVSDVMVGDTKDDKKDGDKKCGAGKCGGDKKDAKCGGDKKDSKCGSDKKDHKCGDSKDGKKAKCGNKEGSDNKDKKKCGEGKCGSK